MQVLKSKYLEKPTTRFCNIPSTKTDFPGGSEGKESTCNAGDQGSIPGLGSSP